MKKYLRFIVLVFVLFFGVTSCQTVKDKTDKIIKKEENNTKQTFYWWFYIVVIISSVLIMNSRTRKQRSAVEGA